MRRLSVAALGVAVLFGMLLYSLPADASTPSHQRSGNHVTRHRKHRPARNCDGLGHLATRGPHALTDDHNPQSPLVRGIRSLICSAGDGSTIDIKQYFVLVGSAESIQGITHALWLMHHYHHVRVNIAVGRNYYTPPRWRLFRTRYRFAHLSWCWHGCLSTHYTGVSHGKWIAVSRLKASLGGGTAVLSTSTNLSTQQFGVGQSGILIVRNAAVYQAFNKQFQQYVACYEKRACDRLPRTATWYGSHDVHVYFTPAQNDPIIDMFNGLNCTHGGTVSIMSLGISQPAFIRAMQRMKTAGCAVRALIYHAVTAPKLGNMARCVKRQHDKAVIIDVGRRHLVIEGSLDFNAGGAHNSDNQMVRTDSQRVVRAYHHYFAQQKRRSQTCQVPPA